MRVSERLNQEAKRIAAGAPDTLSPNTSKSVADEVEAMEDAILAVRNVIQQHELNSEGNQLAEDIIADVYTAIDSVVII